VVEEVDRRSARRWFVGRGEWTPGLIMVALWFTGVILFLSFAVTLHVVASVLTRLCT
jgi:hypothetical protein